VIDWAVRAAPGSAARQRTGGERGAVRIAKNAWDEGEVAADRKRRRQHHDRNDRSTCCSKLEIAQISRRAAIQLSGAATNAGLGTRSRLMAAVRATHQTKATMTQIAIATT